MVSRWKTQGSKVDTMWFLQDTTGFPHGCHVVSIWTACVVEVTTWKPAQKQLCMKPTGFLVITDSVRYLVTSSPSSVSKASVEVVLTGDDSRDTKCTSLGTPTDAGLCLVVLNGFTTCGLLG